MRRRPGGEIANRPLPFMWLCDCSGSMSLDGKIAALNKAVRDALPYMRQEANENPNADVLLRVLKFSHGAEWVHTLAVPLEDFEWHELVADPLERPTVDIIFMVDTSGSMADEIEAVKRSCISFSDQIIREGADVRLGLVGFDIGGHRGGEARPYKVYNLSRYTIGVWPLASPVEFSQHVQSLSLGLFGGGGCYLANRDTVDIFPHVVSTFDASTSNSRLLVVISDEMGDSQGLAEIVLQLRSNSIKAHVLGVPGDGGPHQSIAEQTGGSFCDITRTKGAHDFSEILKAVAVTIALETKKQLLDGTVSAGTDMGEAIRLVAEQLRMPPMTERGLPPVLVLVSDGQPTDDFEGALKVLLDQPWGRKAVKVAIAIGKDTDLEILQKFIGHTELKPLLANNPETLARLIRWASTAVLKSASAPASQGSAPASGMLNVPIPAPSFGTEAENSTNEVW